MTILTIKDLHLMYNYKLPKINKQVWVHLKKIYLALKKYTFIDYSLMFLHIKSISC